MYERLVGLTPRRALSLIATTRDSRRGRYVAAITSECDAGCDAGWRQRRQVSQTRRPVTWALDIGGTNRGVGSGRGSGLEPRICILQSRGNCSQLWDRKSSERVGTHVNYVIHRVDKQNFAGRDDRVIENFHTSKTRNEGQIETLGIPV
ncbi:hypothetical protein J6590_036031 [Homalodisca vitripennis]|nr:hypothetical protein J6590_072492 [Homalodisca vitripennis]KAG8306954.1 hypothetical protein J6590_036031 [Homalodisca vitripennis]